MPHPVDRGIDRLVMTGNSAITTVKTDVKQWLKWGGLGAQVWTPCYYFPSSIDAWAPLSPLPGLATLTTDVKRIGKRIM